MKTKLSLAAFLSLITTCSLCLNAHAVETEATVKGEKKVVVERRHRVVKNEVFHVAPDAKIHVGDNKNATLADLKTGTVIHVAYTEENGVRTANRIADAVPKTGDKHVANSEPAHKGEKHLHGVLESVDSAANTLVVRARR